MQVKKSGKGTYHIVLLPEELQVLEEIVKPLMIDADTYVSGLLQCSLYDHLAGVTQNPVVEVPVET